MLRTYARHCLAQRWEQEGGVGLSHYADDDRSFFVEVKVGVDDGDECRQAIVLRSFSEVRLLEEYSYGLKLLLE